MRIQRKNDRHQQLVLVIFAIFILAGMIKFFGNNLNTVNAATVLTSKQEVRLNPLVGNTTDSMAHEELWSLTSSEVDVAFSAR